MVTRFVFLLIALAIGGTFAWAYHHDAQLQTRMGLVTIGDPNEAVRDLLGEAGGPGNGESRSVNQSRVPRSSEA